MPSKPSVLVALALLQALALAWFAHGGEPTPIAIADAASYEGQGDVRVRGLAAGLRAAGDGTRLTLEEAGHALDALVEGALHAPRGSWVEATGRVARLGGTLTLLAEQVRIVEPPGPHRVAWPDLARDPGAWRGKALLLVGTVEGGWLRDGEGHAARLGDGPWPRAGVVEAVASIAYDGRCLCHVLHAAAVSPLGTAGASAGGSSGSPAGGMEGGAAGHGAGPAAAGATSRSAGA